MRYLEDADREEEEDNDDVGALGLQLQSSSNQLKYKYLGKIFRSRKNDIRINLFRFIQRYAILCSISSNN